MHAASITKTGNQQHAWMTLRVPTTGAGHLENMHQLQQQKQPQPLNPVGFRQQQPHLEAMMVVQSKTLGRQPNNNNVNGHIVMPNPDDILPKEAWTDFSGNDEWPRFSGIVSAAAAAAADRKSASALTSDNNNSSTRLYVNCPSSSSGRVVQRGLISDSKDDEDDADQDAANGNRENSLNSALNGLRPPPSPAAMTSALDDNEGQQHSWNENFSQQIENNLMASSVSRGAVGVGEGGGLRDSKKQPTAAAAVGISEDNSSQGHVRSEIRSKPPVPPPRNCISHQRKTRTKKQQSKGLHYLASEETNGSGGGRHGRRGHHANDEKSSSGGSSGSDSADDSQDESDNDLEQSLLFQQPPPDSSSQWHQSPLLQ